jgi:hypothetical protein
MGDENNEDIPQFTLPEEWEIDCGPNESTIDGLRLVRTCAACPEQYDVFEGETQVAYLRLRHGRFRADVPDCGGDTVYSTEDCKGGGNFASEERLAFLTEAIAYVRAWQKLSESERQKIRESSKNP